MCLVPSVASGNRNNRTSRCRSKVKSLRDSARFHTTPQTKETTQGKIRVRALDWRGHICVRRRLSWARSPMPMKHKDCEERNEPATLTERGLAAIQSPRKPNGLSHCIFECLIVEASSRAQNHLSVLADRYTERCRGIFDCIRDG